ncbi:unnamed protein product [Dicrocoelium dendriticum]|nr:unnamed protein product [Dicrocoelium dendriticum]
MDSDSQERVIPISTDSRTFEQKKKDMMTDLNKNNHQEAKARKAVSPKKLNETNSQHRRRDWADEIDHWLGGTYKRWNDYMRRMERDTFSLVPTTDFDLEPFVPLGSFGHIPSILQRMERQLEAANRHLDNFPMLTEHGEWGSIVPSYARTDGPLDFLKDAYEVGEDGKLHFKVTFNVKGFGPKDIKVSTSKNRLTVHGKKSSKTNSSSSSSEFCRTIYLPESVDDDRFQCHLTSDGILMLEAPVKTPDYQSLTFNHEPQLAVKPSTDKSSALQVTGVTGPTVLKDGATGQKLHVEVPIEPGFTPDDLNVRIDANRVVVSGRKHVVEESGSSHCSHTKEFHRAYTIPETVDPLSVVTQLQGETLVVEAPMVKST